MPGFGKEFAEAFKNFPQNMTGMTGNDGTTTTNNYTTTINGKPVNMNDDDIKVDDFNKLFRQVLSDTIKTVQQSHNNPSSSNSSTTNVVNSDMEEDNIYNSKKSIDLNIDRDDEKFKDIKYLVKNRSTMFDSLNDCTVILCPEKRTSREDYDKLLFENEDFDEFIEILKRLLKENRDADRGLTPNIINSTTLTLILRKLNISGNYLNILVIQDLLNLIHFDIYDEIKLSLIDALIDFIFINKKAISTRKTVAILGYISNILIDNCLWISSIHYEKLIDMFVYHEIVEIHNHLMCTILQRYPHFKKSTVKDKLRANRIEFDYVFRRQFNKTFSSLKDKMIPDEHNTWLAEFDNDFSLLYSNIETYNLIVDGNSFFSDPKCKDTQGIDLPKLVDHLKRINSQYFNDVYVVFNVKHKKMIDKYVVDNIYEKRTEIIKEQVENLSKYDDDDFKNETDEEKILKRKIGNALFVINNSLFLNERLHLVYSPEKEDDKFLTLYLYFAGINNKIMTNDNYESYVTDFKDNHYWYCLWKHMFVTNKFNLEDFE